VQPDCRKAPVRKNKFDLELFKAIKKLATHNGLPFEMLQEIIIIVLESLIEDAKLIGDYVLEREFGNLRSTAVFSPNGRLVASTGIIISTEGQLFAALKMLIKLQ